MEFIDRRPPNPGYYYVVVFSTNPTFQIVVARTAAHPPRPLPGPNIGAAWGIGFLAAAWLVREPRAVEVLLAVLRFCTAAVAQPASWIALVVVAAYFAGTRAHRR